MLTLRQVRYFLAVAETGKVSAAAAGLGVSQSAVTLSIKDLEASLGVSLFQRRAGGVSLTAEGQKFVGHARDIEASVADAAHSMKSASDDVEGHIRIGVTYTSAGYFLFPPLSQFRRSHPAVTVELKELEREALEEAVLAGEVDLALILVSNVRRDARLKRRHLVRSPRGLWLSSAHPLMRRRGIALADLSDQPFVLFRADEADRSARRYWKSAGFAPKVVLETGSLEAVRGMVAAGEAVTILSRLIYRPWSLDGGRVEFRALKDRIPTMDLGLAWRRDHAFSEAETRLSGYLANAAKSHYA